MQTDKLTLAVLVLVLLAIGFFVYRGERQAAQLQEVVRAQSPLTFQFASTGASGQTTIVDVICTRIPAQNVYACATEPRTPPAPRVSPAPTPRP